MMTILFSVAQIERFKREAKLLCRNNHRLTHSAALDLIAVQHNYPNWSVLHKHSFSYSNNNPLSTNSEVKPSFLFDRTWDEMKKALRTLPVDWRHSRMEEALSSTEDICNRFISARNGVDFAVAYVSSLLEMPRFYIYQASRANWEMRCWLPYCVHPVKFFDTNSTSLVLLNRRYKPIGLTSKDWVEYEAYPALHLHLTDTELKKITSHQCNLGYLFNDGTSPWRSRCHAEQYLVKLRDLQGLLG